MLPLMLSITVGILPARFILDNAALGAGIALGTVLTYVFPWTQAERANNRPGSDSHTAIKNSGGRRNPMARFSAYRIIIFMTGVQLCGSGGAVLLPGGNRCHWMKLKVYKSMTCPRNEQ
jgi:hypothetical protein